MDTNSSPVAQVGSSKQGTMGMKKSFSQELEWVEPLGSRPGLESEAFHASSGNFFHVQPGIVLKSPVTTKDRIYLPEYYGPKGCAPEIFVLQEDNIECFDAEEKILNRLGQHPRIVRYLGPRREFPPGLLFEVAEPGSLQQYLDDHHNDMAFSLRQKFFFQAIEAVVFIHSKNVLHCDMRPDNFLVYGSDTGLELCMCDFGGSACEELELPGCACPSPGFHDPNIDHFDKTFAMDIFSLGSTLYVIMTGHWPFAPLKDEASFDFFTEEYWSQVDDRFAAGDFPEVDGLFGGEVIMGCWKHEFSTAEEVLACASKLDVKH
ncbi:hypothetical protein E4U43_007086 [Claviceps pusilla]|uniref:EKC/KEOPS complex subunit BUD32 n=1 Tax=Claviceps pusilla TaxID=123648 RepID=A0A9P7NF16_9HYPO|nr:hypothetical protein E4U43_007086 [Claviceps pusilla]